MGLKSAAWFVISKGRTSTLRFPVAIDHLPRWLPIGLGLPQFLQTRGEEQSLQFVSAETILQNGKDDETQERNADADG
jgi:hypothetical protein